MTAEHSEYGVVLTATELEGCSPAADWSRWIAKGRAPDSERGSAKTGFASSWAEDLEQLAGLGATAVTITLEWADLEPRQNEFDNAAIEFRRDVLTTAIDLGLTPWGCLVDGTLPGWFADDEGGFQDDRARGLLWPRHVDWIGENFGDLVGGWIPQREPLHRALLGHLLGTAPPGVRNVSTAANAAKSAVLADGEAWRLLAGTAPVATYQTARQIYFDHDDVKARPRAAGLERLLWHPWISAITEGQLVVGDLPTTTVDHLRDGFDRVIVELRPGIEIGPEGQWRRQRPDVGSMAETLRRVADELGSHEVVAAGSLAGVVDDGRTRPDHVQQALDATAEAIEETSVVGWWQSSPIDGYHGDQAGTLRPGLIAHDRTETAAAATFRDHGDR